jgi:uncharacterized oligopeptide transporter (OPT) family protein
MAIPHLTDQQIATMSREEKDKWWLANVFRGNMPQLTIRSAITGFILGGLLSATNLYIGAKTGWTLGVGLTSVILAFLMFKTMSGIGLARDFTILENNAMQSIATAAGYMTGPLISGMAAYMMVTDTRMPWHQMMWFNVVLSVLGVLVAFPMKRRFINEEQAPFPEGAACGVVLDTLYTSDPKVGLFKAWVLVAAATFAGFLKFCGGEAYQTLLQAKILGLKSVVWLAENLDHWYYEMVKRGQAPVPRIMGVDIRNVGLSPTLDLAMFGAGGLMNIRYATNMFAGVIVAWVFCGPLAVSHGWVMRKGVVLDPSSTFSYRDVLTAWNLWPGVAMLVCASITALFAKPKVIISAFTGLFKKKAGGPDVLGHIEVPLWISWVGVPIVGAVGVWMAHEWFQVKYIYGALSIPLIILLTLIAANATALTSITPTGSLSKITQFTFGVLNPSHPPTNLMTACMTTEVASNASNLLMDIKPGYMLGGKPRHQVLGHMIGIFAGAIASTPLFYLLFVRSAPPGLDMQHTLVRGEFSFTAALQWKGISEFINGLTSDAGLTSVIHPTAITAMAIGAVLGIALEIARVATKGKSPVSPVAFALGFVLPPDSSIWMFLGSLFFWTMGLIYKPRPEKFGNKLWVQTHEPICAGLIAGAALVGIGDILVGTFLV